MDDFWKRHFANRGVFMAAWTEYDSLDEFAQRLEQSLRKLIEKRIQAQTTESGQPSAIWAGNPFRGLEAYEFEHAAIFFGRDGVVAKAVEQLATGAWAGSSFLLVSGPSGSGKSSLVKAALVPRLMKPQLISGAAFIRRATYRPGDAGGDLIRGLVDALVRSSTESSVGVPELLAPGQSVADLAEHLRASVDSPSFVFSGALGRLTADGRRSGRLLAFEEAKLVLVIDQLEELFTIARFGQEERRLFIRLLDGLARSGAVWIIATMRADFWHRAAELPELMTLAEGRGRIELTPPSAAELGEMIRKPALAGGLSFEVHPQTGLGLDAVLAEHATAEPGVLPLLSFTLDALYATDVAKHGGRILTYATFESLGGLEGAIATRADEIIDAQPAAAQSALPQVLRTLTTVSTGSDHLAVARTVPLAYFPEGGAARSIIDALISARLLVASTVGTTPTVRLAHEALITHWHRARDQIVADRRDLETRAEIESHYRSWVAASGRTQKQLLLRDPYLASAIDLEKRWGDELELPTRQFIHVSRRRARFRQQLTAAAAVVLAFFAVAAAVAAQQAFQAKGLAQQKTVEATEAAQQATVAKELAQQKTVEATEAAQQAIVAKNLAQQKSAEAIEQRERALRTQGRLLAEKASRLTEQGDTQNAIAVALEAFRRTDEEVPARYDAGAAKSLANALYRYPFQQVLRHDDDEFVRAAFTFDDSKIVAVTAKGSVQSWDRSENGAYQPGQSFPTSLGSIAAVISNPARPVLLLIRTDRTFVAWDYQAAAVLRGVEGTCDRSKDSEAANMSEFFKFDPTGARLIANCKDLQIFDLSNGRLVTKRGPYDFFSMSGNGKRLVTAKEKGAIETWNVLTGDRIKSWKDDDFANQFVAMSQDGEVALVGHRYGVQFWSATSATKVGAELKGQARIDGIVTSTFDDLFATSGDDGTNVRSVERQASIQRFSDHVAAFLPNRLAIVPVDKKLIELWAFLVEGHMGTSSPQKIAVMSSSVDQKYVDANTKGKTIISIGGGVFISGRSTRQCWSRRPIPKVSILSA